MFTYLSFLTDYDETLEVQTISCQVKILIRKNVNLINMKESVNFISAMMQHPSLC